MLLIFGLILFASFNCGFGATQPCATVAPITYSWAGTGSNGFEIKSVYIPITEDITSWTLDVTFSSPIVFLIPWNALLPSVDSLLHFRLVNTDYNSNGAQKAGTVFSGVKLTVIYPFQTTPPVITSILFNGVNICAAGNPSTTTKATTTAKAVPRGSASQQATKYDSKDVI